MHSEDTTRIKRSGSVEHGVHTYTIDGEMCVTVGVVLWMMDTGSYLKPVEMRDC